MINDDIDAIIQRGEERTTVLNSKYEGLTFEDLSNFKSEASVQQWEGEDFRSVSSEVQIYLPFAMTQLLVVAQAVEFQYAVDAETRTQDELLCRCLLQGCDAHWAKQNRESTEVASRAQTDSNVGRPLIPFVSILMYLNT